MLGTELTFRMSDPSDSTTVALMFAKTVAKFAEFTVELAESLHKDLGLEYHPPVKGRVSKKRKAADPNAPKKPKTAYFLFADAVREKAKREERSIPDAKKMGELWAGLNEEEKSEYNEAAELAKELYAKELENFNDDNDDVPPPRSH